MATGIWTRTSNGRDSVRGSSLTPSSTTMWRPNWAESTMPAMVIQGKKRLGISEVQPRLRPVP